MGCAHVSKANGVEVSAQNSRGQAVAKGEEANCRGAVLQKKMSTIVKIRNDISNGSSLFSLPHPLAAEHLFFQPQAASQSHDEV